MIVQMTGEQLRSKESVFSDLLRLRHDVFIKQRKWSLPAGRDIERDQYDVPSAIYFFDLTDGRIESHVRLTPTATHSLMADYFPHLVERGVSARDERIYEATRYVVKPHEKSRENNRAAKARLLTSMLEWAKEHRLTHIQTVIDTSALASFVEMTPQTIVLGLSHPYGGGPQVVGGGECTAIRWPVNDAVVDDLRRYGGQAVVTAECVQCGNACGSCAA